MTAPLGPVEVVCLFGRRGSGKTTLARRLVAPLRRVIAWDPLGEWGTFSRFARCEDLEELRAILKRQWGRGWRCAYVGGAGELVGALDALARFIWAAQAPYPRCAPVALVVDEANLGLPVHKLPKGMTGMARLVLQGRHRGVSILAISQRPALVSLDLRANAHRTIAFALPAPQDRRALTAQFGRAADELGRLPDYHFLEEAAGRVTRKRSIQGRAA